jgi:hypothetical protein
MKALVIYDTQFGNTERLARLITDTLLKRIPVRLLSAHEVVAYDFGAVDLLIFGCPTQKHRCDREGARPETPEGVERRAIFDVKNPREVAVRQRAATSRPDRRRASGGMIRRACAGCEVGARLRARAK